MKDRGHRVPFKINCKALSSSIINEFLLSDFTLNYTANLSLALTQLTTHHRREKIEKVSNFYVKFYFILQLITKHTEQTRNLLFYLQHIFRVLFFSSSSFSFSFSFSLPKNREKKKTQFWQFLRNNELREERKEKCQ